MPQADSDYKKLLTEVIKKQIVILGPDITLAKSRNVNGLTIADDGTVTDISGSPQEITQALIDQFVQLSGLIVKKTMEPLLTLSSSGIQAAQAAANAAAAATPQPVIPVAPQSAIVPPPPPATPPVPTSTPTPTDIIPGSQV